MKQTAERSLNNNDILNLIDEMEEELESEPIIFNESQFQTYEEYFEWRKEVKSHPVEYNPQEVK